VTFFGTRSSPNGWKVKPCDLLNVEDYKGILKLYETICVHPPSNGDYFCIFLKGQRGKIIAITRFCMLLPIIRSRWKGWKGHHLQPLKAKIGGLFLHVKVMIVMMKSMFFKVLKRQRFFCRIGSVNSNQEAS
jgi:hypothetical protein